MSNDVIERIESKVAYLEHANNELSDVVYRQQREIEELHTRLAAVVERVDALKGGEPVYTPEQERPPHY